MDKILVIAEKPSVGRDIARVLKCDKKSDGYLYSEEYVISWAIGHLVTLKNPEDYDSKLKSWRFETLPILPEKIELKSIKTTEKQLKILRKLMNDKEISSIVCATDSGREGELIFRYIYDICKCNKSVKRLWISSMTDKAIMDGFKNLKDSSEYDNLYKSAKCRSEADWLVGINATRAYTLKYKALLSIGRVQTPTLCMICERQKEINAFVPKEYFEIKAEFEKYEGLYFDKKTNESKIEDKSKAEEILEKIKNQIGTVENIENEEKKQPPPLLYDLTELQRECNRKFGYSAKDTLAIAQELYEKKKLITYPRTDSRYLSDDMIIKIKNILNRIKNVQQYEIYANYVLSLEKLPITKRIVDNSKVTDHHAIIPTDNNINVQRLNAKEYNVFNLIVRRFLAVFYPNYIYNVCKITTTVLDESFMTKGNTIIALGYMELYKDEKNEKDKDDEVIIPELKIGEKYNVTKQELLAKKTTPPKNYTEATILSAMENAGRFVEDEELKEKLKSSGIGTPATRAAIIERLIEVNYIERKGKSLIPTEKGMKLIEVVAAELKSPETTGKWEKGLDSISKGNMDTDKFMGSIKKYVNFLVSDSKTKNADIFFPTEESRKKTNHVNALGNCPLCEDGKIFENSKAFFCSNWRNGCKFNIWKNCLEKYGVNLDQNILKKLLKNKIVEKIDLVQPSTMEKCKADLIINLEMNDNLEFINLNRIEQIND